MLENNEPLLCLSFNIIINGFFSKNVVNRIHFFSTSPSVPREGKLRREVKKKRSKH